VEAGSVLHKVRCGIACYRMLVDMHSTHPHSKQGLGKRRHSEVFGSKLNLVAWRGELSAYNLAYRRFGRAYRGVEHTEELEVRADDLMFCFVL
jgi:hypothetical protein